MYIHTCFFFLRCQRWVCCCWHRTLSFPGLIWGISCASFMMAQKTPAELDQFYSERLNALPHCSKQTVTAKKKKQKKHLFFFFFTVFSTCLNWTVGSLIVFHCILCSYVRLKPLKSTVARSFPRMSCRIGADRFTRLCVEQSWRKSTAPRL